MERQGERPIRTDDIASGGGEEAPRGGEAPADPSRAQAPPHPDAGHPTAQAGPSGETAAAGPPPTGGSTWQPQSPASVTGPPGHQPPGGAAAGAAPPAPGGTTGAAAAPVAPHGSPGAPAQPAHGGLEHTEGGAPPARADWQGGGAPTTESAATVTGTSRDSDSTPLLPDADAGDFERRWADLQVGFVDEPQRCVQEADGLVAEVMQRLADGFARERQDLEAQWASGGEASTEDLRVALQRYRSFFNRLLRTS